MLMPVIFVRLSFPREARLTALIAATQQDCVIASHDTKYTYWRLRPNMADATIVPYIAQPAHPSYPSNAAVIFAAEAEVAASLSPTDAASFRA